MRKHLGRTLLIAAAILIAAVNLYPTLGWYRLDEAEQQRRIEQWRSEDIDLRREGAGIFARTSHSIKKWSQFNRDMVINLGLDLQGGVLMVLGFDFTEEMKARGMVEADVQRMVLNTVTNRIGEFEATEPLIQTLGTNQVQIQLPGQKDIQRARDLMTRTAKLGFHLVSGPDESLDIIRKVDAFSNNGFVPFLESPSQNAGSIVEVETANYDIVKKVVDDAVAAGVVPENLTIAFSPAPKDWQNSTRREVYVMDREEKMSGKGIKSASPQTDTRSPGNWMIAFEFTGDASDEFARLTEENIGRQMAIVVDDNVVSAPNIKSRIFGSGVIEGQFSADESKDLAIALNSGSLPVPVKEEYAAIVGASIGQEAVQKGVYASVIGLTLVVISVLAWYRFAGLIAVMSLAFNGLLVLSAFAYFDITLTLPGIAGLVLTIGMAVDSNVLIYERIREEQLLGKSLANCIQAGFQNAASAILDSNVTTLIAAGVLLQFGTGAIQGFAIALAIGVVSTLISALVFTRALVEFVSDRQIVSRFKMTELIPLEPRIDFMGKRRICVIGSLVATAIGIGIFAMRGDDNFGVDFRTGTNARIAINAESPISDGEVRDRIVAAGFTEPIVQHYVASGEEAANTFIIRVGQTESLEGAEGAVSTRLQQALLPLSGNPSSPNLDEQIELLAVESVGPAVGAQLRLDAVNTMLYALLFIILYLWFRFEWKFALGAVVAMAHDVLIVVSVMSALGQQITIPVIAALLTIIGYSLNDTIVVFDRVREDVALNKSRGLSFLTGLNISINRTLSRTLLTSTTTMMVLIVLFFFGGDELKPFSLAMIIGIVVGTYSSIYIASPVVLAWQNFIDKRHARRLEADKAPRRRKTTSPVA
jgi:SecD/SecF fusion protein